MYYYFDIILLLFYYYSDVLLLLSVYFSTSFSYSHVELVLFAVCSFLVSDCLFVAPLLNGLVCPISFLHSYLFSKYFHLFVVLVLLFYSLFLIFVFLLLII